MYDHIARYQALLGKYVDRCACLQTNHEGALTYVITIMDVPINLELLSVQDACCLRNVPSTVPKHLNNEVSLDFFSYEFSSSFREFSRCISSEIIARLLTLLM